ncbi:MAG TPA: phage holin family protein [Thermoanaerobaculia bacterium]|nr:phage holin family protein [Thermoanaerobaculia bacterium]
MVAAGRAGWGELLGRIGRSAVELWRGELAALQSELGESWRVLLRALLLSAIAGFLAFWVLGLSFVAMVAALALFLPVWAAAAIVMVVTGIVAYLVWRSAHAGFRELELPWITIRRRVSDHVVWWQDQLLPPEDDAAAPGSDDGDSDDGDSDDGDSGVER